MLARRFRKPWTAAALRASGSALATVLAVALATVLVVALSAQLVLGPPGEVGRPLIARVLAEFGRAVDPGAYRAPVTAPWSVVDPFDDTPDPYAAGHRGVDLALDAGGPVLAAGDGVVSFAGPVAGRSLIVLRHSDGVSTEYEPLTVAVRTGQQVARGQRIGTLAASHPGCARSCLHWGARREGVYFDPLILLRPLGVVRLAPCHARGWACS